MIEYLKASLEAQAQTAQAIEGESVPALPAPAPLEQPRKRPNRLLEHVNTAIGPRERKPRKRVPSPPGA
jgi:hypothetical protein